MATDKKADYYLEYLKWIDAILVPWYKSQISKNDRFSKKFQNDLLTEVPKLRTSLNKKLDNRKKELQKKSQPTKSISKIEREIAEVKFDLKYYNNEKNLHDAGNKQSAFIKNYKTILAKIASNKAKLKVLELELANAKK
jgi:hypothetical protein